MIRVSSVVFWAIFTVVTSVALYHTSYHVQSLERQLHNIKTQTEAERARVHVLRAEWSYLTNPERIEKAARKYLALRPTSSQQVFTSNNVNEALIRHSEASGKSGQRSKSAAVDRSYIHSAPPPGVEKSAFVKYDDMSALLADLELTR